MSGRTAGCKVCPVCAARWGDDREDCPACGRRLELPGRIAAARRLVDAGGSIRDAFESLGLFTFDQALEYVRETPTWRSFRLSEQDEARLFGVVLAFAVTVVEADREAP